jgi:hypothetical protein
MADLLKYGALGLTLCLAMLVLKLIRELLKREKPDKHGYYLLFSFMGFALLLTLIWIYVEQPKRSLALAQDKKGSYTWVTYNRSGCSIQLPSIFRERSITATTQYYQADASDDMSVKVDCSLSKIPMSQETFQLFFNSKLAEEGSVVYQIFKGNFFVVSGNRSNGKRYYHKAILKDKSYYLMSLEYPPRYQNLLDDVMTNISKSFK